MADKIKNVLMKSASVMVTYDKTTLNKIEFMLPNNKMASLKLVTTQQQIEINNSIQCYTSGKNCINWSTVGVHNVIDLIRALKRHTKLLKDSYFNKMKADIHFNHIDMLENSIIVELDGTQMFKLNPEWENEMASEFEKHKVFHHFESVIINRKNKNKNENKNNNKNITNTDTDDKNLDTFDSIFEVWNMEIKNIQNELKHREKEICNVMTEPFGLLATAEKINKRMDSTLKVNHSFDIKLHLKPMKKKNELEQTRRDSKFDSNVNEDILNIKNNVRLNVENLLHQKIEMKERNEINKGIIKEIEMHIAKMNDFLSEKKKDKGEVDIIRLNKHIIHIIAECHDLMNKNANCNFILEQKMCKLNEIYDFNTIMYDNCLKDIKNTNLDAKYDAPEDFDGSLNCQKQKRNNNNVNVQGWDISLLNTVDSLIIKSNSIKYDSYDLIDTASENLSYLTSIATTISERSLINLNNFNNGNSISNVHRMDDTNDSNAQDSSNHCNKNSVNNCSSSNDVNDDNVDCLIGKSVQCFAYRPTARTVRESSGGSVVSQGNTCSLIGINVQGWYNGNVYYDDYG